MSQPKNAIVAKFNELFADAYRNQIKLNEGQPMGVDQIKMTITDIFRIAAAISVMFKKFTAEALFEFASVMSRYEKPGETFAKVILEIQDLDLEEAESVYQHATEEFDIEDDEKEAKIERVMKLPVLTYQEWVESVAAVEKVQAVLRSDSPWTTKLIMLAEDSDDLLRQGFDAVDTVVEYYLAVKDLFKKADEESEKILKS